MSLNVVTEEPLNAEASLSALDQRVTPVSDFYVRCNFPAPRLEASEWTLRVRGVVDEPLTFGLDELRSLPSVERLVTLECAGNGRRLMEPVPPGTAWRLGAAGTAVFTGVPLASVLERAGVGPGAVECVFTGADRGEVEGGGVVPFQRSLPLEWALGDGPLLAWAMNGEPLTVDHGYPVRLVVPRFYAVASVKWLVDIEVIDQRFEGHFQSDRYVYRAPGEPEEPVTTMRVRSLITSHADEERTPAGGVTIEGVAWSGDAPIDVVELRVDDGSWLPAELDGDGPAGVACRWRLHVSLAPGRHEIRVRATDAGGATQPVDAHWNELGYGGNAQHRIRVIAG